MHVLLRRTAALLAALMLIAAPTTGFAQGEAEDSVTLKVYPRVSHEHLLGLAIPWGKPETVTVRDYRIADMRGDARDHVLLETASGLTRLKFDDIRRIDFVSYPRQYSYTDRMESVAYTVRANVFLVDGTRIQNAIINAYFGTVEGQTELGHFFLSDPLSLGSITFNGH